MSLKNKTNFNYCLTIQTYTMGGHPTRAFGEKGILPADRDLKRFRLSDLCHWRNGGANAVARGGRLLLSILSQFRFVCVDESTRLYYAQAPSQHWGGLKR